MILPATQENSPPAPSKAGCESTLFQVPTEITSCGWLAEDSREFNWTTALEADDGLCSARPMTLWPAARSLWTYAVASSVYQAYVVPETVVVSRALPRGGRLFQVSPLSLQD